jgi:hypothetical protein
MDISEEILLLLYMDKSPEEIVSFGYPKTLVFKIFSEEFEKKLETYDSEEPENN